MGGTSAGSPPWWYAPPPCIRAWGSCAHTAAQGSGHKACACWRGADYVLRFDLFQPAFDCMGRWPGHRIHAGAPRQGWRLLCAHTCSVERPQTVCVCLVRRRVCLTGRALSISHWKPGTSARLLTCMCAAALRLSQGSCAHTAAQASGHKPCACAGAVYAPRGDCFQPAFGCMGRRPGY